MTVSRTTTLGPKRIQYNRARSFKTQAEAEAFRDGVELVNDSALTVVGVAPRRGRFTVFLWDYDATDWED